MLIGRTNFLLNHGLMTDIDWQ